MAVAGTDPPPRRDGQSQTKTPVILRLGEYEFSDWDAPQGFSYGEKSVYAEHAVLEGKPQIQYIGEDLNSLDFKFRLHAGWCNPDQRIALLQGMRRSRQSYDLQIGSGIFRGRYVVRDVSVELKLVDQLGKLIWADVSVKLLEDITPVPAEVPPAQNPFSKKGAPA